MIMARRGRMSEVIFTLISVAFGALLSYIFQQISESKSKRNEMRIKKINLFHSLIKIDKLNGPNIDSMHAYHFDDVAFIEKVYPVLLGDYYYFPDEVCVKFDQVYLWIKNVEFNGIPEEVPSSKEFYTHLSNIYTEGIESLEKELKSLIE